MVYEPILAVRDLCATITGGRRSRILDGVDLTVDGGEILALVGESGSGKTSLGLAIQGLLTSGNRMRVSGSIKVCGREVIGTPDRGLRPLRRTLVRAVPQDGLSALNPTMTIAGQLAESANVGPAAVLEWLARTGLPEPDRIASRYPHQLSGGQRQRALIAMAMMARPKLLIADEPTTALDTDSRSQILNLLVDIAREESTAVLFITHDLSASARIADRIAVLYAGRVVETGKASDLIKTPAHPYSAGLVAARFNFESDRSSPLPVLSEDDTAVASGDACDYAPRCPIALPSCVASRPALQGNLRHPGEAACFLSQDMDGFIAQVSPVKPWPAPETSPQTTVMELRGVSKSFAERAGTFKISKRAPVLQQVDLRISSGEAVALIGASGSGKSTLLRIAAGLARPDKGAVLTGGADRPQIVFQDAFSSLTPWLTIGEQIADRLRCGTEVAGRQRVQEVLRLVRLRPELADALPSELSVGQCQRAVVARAVAIPPPLLLCDEPISSLDASLAAATLNLLGELRRRFGMAILFVTHDLAAARYIADRIVWLHGGAIKELGDADTFRLPEGNALANEGRFESI